MKEIRKGNMIYIKNIIKKRVFIYIKVIYVIMIYVTIYVFVWKYYPIEIFSIKL